VDLERRLLAKGVKVESLVLPDDVPIRCCGELENRNLGDVGVL